MVSIAREDWTVFLDHLPPYIALGYGDQLEWAIPGGASMAVGSNLCDRRSSASTWPDIYTCSLGFFLELGLYNYPICYLTIN
jgi:hypothetical protein